MAPDHDRSFGALVLAGTYGWGKPRACGLPPRPLAPVALRPLIAYTLDWFAAHGASDIAICAHGDASLIEACLGRRYGVATLRYVHDRMPRGPAGCIRDAAIANDDQPLVVAEGTILPVLSLDDLLANHRATRAALTIVATHEPGTGLQPSGIYVVDRRTLDFIPAHGFQDIKETLIPRLHRMGECVTVYRPPAAGRRVANLETYLTANYWAVRQLATLSPLVTPRSRLVAHSTASIADDVVLAGDVVIGAGARLESGATVVGPAVIGRRTIVSSGGVIARSVVGDDCSLETGAFVHVAVVASRARVEAGARVVRGVRVPDPRGRSWWYRFRPAADGPSIAEPAGPPENAEVPWLPMPAAAREELAATAARPAEQGAPTCT